MLYKPSTCWGPQPGYVHADYDAGTATAEEQETEEHMQAALAQAVYVLYGLEVSDDADCWEDYYQVCKHSSMPHAVSMLCSYSY